MRIVRFVGGLGLVGIIGVGGHHVINEYSSVSDLDTVEKAVQSGERTSILQQLEALLLNEDPHVVRKAEDLLIGVYKDLGNEVGRTSNERALYYLKAQMIDPDCLTLEQEQFVLEYRKFRH